MIFQNRFLSSYCYHYNKEYPINMFIKNRKQKKVKNINTQKDANIYFDTNVNSLNTEIKKNDITVSDIRLIDSIISNISSNTLNVENKKNQSIKSYEKLKKNFYDRFKIFAIKNLNIKNNDKVLDETIASINKNYNHIDRYNSEIIYMYYDIYCKFLLFNDFKNTYNEFKLFIKKNDIMDSFSDINITVRTLFKKTQKSYIVVKYIIGDNIVNKNKVVNLFYMSKLNIENLSKLNEECIHRLCEFYKNKYTDDNILNLKNIKFDSNDIVEKYNSIDIRKIHNDIPLAYIGSKRKTANKIISTIPFNDNTNKFVELFGGSLCISYLVNFLYPNIEIIVYENDKLLINFYYILKNKYTDFIIRLSNTIDELKKTVDPKKYIKNMVNIINKNLDYIEFTNKVDIACYYYIINKICFRSVLNYNKQNKINVTINEKRIYTLLNFSNKHNEKLYKYSIFLNKITLINMDVTKNYDKILKNLDKNTILYADPPYYSDNKTYKVYQNIFGEEQHIELKLFLDKVFQKGCNWLKNNSFTGYVLYLFSYYRNKMLTVNNNICNSTRMDLLITSFL